MSDAKETCPKCGKPYSEHMLVGWERMCAPNPVIKDLHDKLAEILLNPPTPTAIPAQEAAENIHFVGSPDVPKFHYQYSADKIASTEAPEPIQPHITPTCFSKREREILGLSSNILEPIQPSVELPPLPTDVGQDVYEILEAREAQLLAALARTEKLDKAVKWLANKTADQALELTGKNNSRSDSRTEGA